MKKLILIPGLFCLFLLNVASMCSTDVDSPRANPAPVISIMTQGTWKVTNYSDSGTDETSHFTGYNFTFATSNNAVSATNGTNTYTGTWSVIPEDSAQGSTLDFNITFATPADFAELSEDWDIVSYSTTVIRLTHTGSGSSGNDVLVLTKN